MDSIYIFLLILLSPLLIFIILNYVKKRREEKRWAKVKQIVFSDGDEQLLKRSFPPYKFLSSEEKERLKLKILYFLEYKNFSTIGDFELTESMKLIIAAQACLLIVNLDIEIYPSLVNIFVAADTFIEKENYIDSQTMLPAHVPRLGESWKDGPIVLSWNSVRDGVDNWKDGQNVVLHEFAHQLDNLDGAMDGLPPLEGHTTKKWTILMRKEFFDLRDKVKHHRHNDFGDYALTNPSEFFAVTVEHFFEKPAIFHKNHPDFYKLYQDYFKVDPLKWS